jgi:division protein CdvB (Snf7/Vps24/ESCRT-III family)
MTSIDDARREIAEVNASLAAMSPEASLECAAIARSAKPLTTTPRQREILEEFAREFEQRAAAKMASTQSS